MPRRLPIAEKCPHSWGIKDWPAHVWPGSPSRARYFLRDPTVRNELMIAGALVRIGRDLVLFGEQYGRFMQKRASAVPNFYVEANDPQRRRAARGR
jgi:hypothetical protein